jgi:[ribosomal protein S5]-alanine N-acetyltransferase
MPSFNPFPSLATDHYILRRLVFTDAPAIFTLRTHEEVNRYLDRQRASSLNDVLVFIQKINYNIDNGDAIMWAICTQDNASLMGTVCLYNIDEEKSTAEIGYEVLPAFQGKGITKEVMPAIISFAFNTLALRGIEACVSAANLVSIKLLERHGFGEIPMIPGEPGMVQYRLNAF